MLVGSERVSIQHAPLNLSCFLFYSHTRLLIFITIGITTLLSSNHAYKNLLGIFVLSFLSLFTCARARARTIYLLSYSDMQHLNLHTTNAAYVWRLLIHFSGRLLKRKRNHSTLPCSIFTV
jgi:hypothetical protein